MSSGGGIDQPGGKDGREIVYLAPDAMLMAVSFTFSGEGVTLGKPTPLFKVKADAGGWGANWTATADLTRFVIVEAPEETGQRFRLLSDWMAGE